MTGSKDIFLLGDLNIDWFSINCPLCKKLISMADACGLGQVVTQPTRMSTTSGVNNWTYIDHIFINIQELSSRAVSGAVGCTDHNLTALLIDWLILFVSWGIGLLITYY